MKNRKIVAESKHLYCTHISEEDIDYIKEFKVISESGVGVERFINYFSFVHEDELLDRSYLVWMKETDEMVAFFSLRAGFVARNNMSELEDSFDSLPGIEISNFAVSKRFRDKYPSTKGIGKVIFESIIKPIIKEASEIIGIRMIYIFALPDEKLINYYNDSFGFSRLQEAEEQKMHNRIRPLYDKDCIFMYQRL
ncbi:MULTISPECIES: hypothetical protein [Pseudobutyrivibrio]|uniref:GNAT family N-acetyltransferase n=1 Tax=Pseudobutyrivibrio xylanivorans TaxID=185007 RepID=A0A1G5RPR3_PSEXY|nr:MULTISPECIES: hypothetical protein [Pseudobutyrivibrio]SCZ76113.1 hypothetical protein SAMN02910350_00086 [Pseudobutyrivibrio xylanivorans]